MMESIRWTLSTPTQCKIKFTFQSQKIGKKKSPLPQSAPKGSYVNSLAISTFQSEDNPKNWVIFYFSQFTMYHI